MDIYIKWNDDKKGIHLPVNPSSFELTDDMGNTSVTIHGLGEIGMKGNRNLKSITIASFFPSQDYGFLRDRFQNPYNYVKSINTLFEKNKTVHLVITETEINGFFTIESWNYGHNDRTKDVSYSLTLKEWREIPKAEKSKGGGKARKPKEKKKSTHTWKKGDTFPKVTKKYLGSSATWKDQKKNNAGVIKKAQKKHPKAKLKDALVGYKVVIRP